MALLMSARHITGTTGSFGAAAAIAKAQGLNPGRFAAALGHAASMAAGLRAMFGTDTKTLHMGRAAQNGLLASQLAYHDFDSCSEPIEKWMALVSTNPENQLLSALSRGGPYQILENTFKPYPCGIVIHPLIDAAIQAYESLQPDHGATAIDSIESIAAIVNPQCKRLCSVRHPETGLQTIFSLYHGIAVGILYGRAGPKQFSDQACKDQAAKRIRDLIDVTCDNKLADDAATLRVTFAHGYEKNFQCQHANGSRARPLGVEQLEEKFANMANDILGTTQSRLVVDHCWHLERLEDMRSFVQLLATT
jgi:aconitate decarboxylase